MWGAEDLAASLGSTSNSDEQGHHSPFRLARDLCLVAAKAAGVAAIDTVFTRIDDLAGLAKEAAAARRDGFDAKAVIHPKHVETVNAAFAPTEAEIAWAKEVVDAFAANRSAGVVTLARPDGRQASSQRRGEDSRGEPAIAKRACARRLLPEIGQRLGEALHIDGELHVVAVDRANGHVRRLDAR